MKTLNSKWWLTAAMFASIIIFCAWKARNETSNEYNYMMDQDTSLPRKKMQTSGLNEVRMADLEEAMKDLDRAMADLSWNTKLELGKLNKEMKQAMAEVKKVNFQKINREMETSIKHIELEKSRTDIESALRNAESKIREVDMEKVKQELAKVKLELTEEKLRSHINLEKLKENIDASLEKARAGIEEAKKEMSMFKEFTNNLEKDGLINKNKPYKIEIKSGELYINGTKQSKEINEKYRKYFRGKE